MRIYHGDTEITEKVESMFKNRMEKSFAFLRVLRISVVKRGPLYAV
jgi:hypothetical protein